MTNNIEPEMGDAGHPVSLMATQKYKKEMLGCGSLIKNQNAKIFFGGSFFF